MLTELPGFQSCYKDYNSCEITGKTVDRNVPFLQPYLDDFNTFLIVLL